MYIRPNHRARNDADVVEAIEQNRFATLVTTSPFIASHLPFMIDPQRGEHGTLYAHMARANPQSVAIGNDSEAMVIFNGPHAYISPSWYSDRATAPTWDYVAVHCYGRTIVHSHDEARRNIQRLVTLMESSSPQPWSMSELTEDDMHRMVQNVVSFEMPITRLDAKFKLNQGEKPERTRTAIERLDEQGETAIAAYMRRYNDL